MALTLTLIGLLLVVIGMIRLLRMAPGDQRWQTKARLRSSGNAANIVSAQRGPAGWILAGSVLQIFGGVLALAAECT